MSLQHLLSWKGLYSCWLMSFDHYRVKVSHCSTSCVSGTYGRFFLQGL